MTSGQQFFSHMVTVLVVVTAAIVLSIHRTIDGATAVALIAGVTGLSLGVGAVSIGTGGATPAASSGGIRNDTDAAPAP